MGGPRLQPRLSAANLATELDSLCATLLRAGAPLLAERVRHAGKFRVGSTSELFGEPRTALREVLADARGLLSSSGTSKVQDVIDAIDAEFHRIGDG